MAGHGKSPPVSRRLALDALARYFALGRITGLFLAAHFAGAGRDIIRDRIDQDLDGVADGLSLGSDRFLSQEKRPIAWIWAANGPLQIRNWP